MRLTNEHLLLLLAFVGNDGLTVSDLADRLAVSPREAWWRLRRLELRGYAEKGETRGRVGDRGRPSRVFRIAQPLALPPARKTSVDA